MLGVFLDRDSLDHDDLDLSPLELSLPQWRFYPATGAAETAARIATAEVVVSNKVLLDAALMDQAPNLRLIAVAATGTNNVDLEAASQRGIAVCNVRDYATPSVVQHVFALILNLTRRLDAYRGAALDGTWAASPYFCVLDYPMRELGELTLGIVGYGELGRAVAHTAEQAFGMRVLVANRPGRREVAAGRLPLEELLPQVDILSLHCPLTPQTRGLIGAPQLALMKPDALLINTARGGIVDEAALAEALQAGRLGGAGIDVLASEPPHSPSPLMAPAIPNLVLTPHVAWASIAARQRLVQQLADNIHAFLAGRPHNLVNDPKAQP